MLKEEREDRREALNLAVRHKTRNELAKNVVENAEKYLKFLQDNK